MPELEAIRKQVKKIAVDTCLEIVDVSIVKSIGVHVPHFAVIQSNLASCLQQFILGVTGKDNLKKEDLHPNSNFMTLN